MGSSKVGPAPGAAPAADASSENGDSEVGALRAEVAKLTSVVKQQGEELHALRAATSKEFTVAQYNILAGYLGDNRQPWFLYGLDLTEERRATIMKKFYQKGDDGKFCNVGWPNYVVGILTDEEIAKVVAVNDEHFAWDVRKDRLLTTIHGLDADLLSLVECDYYEEFFLPAMTAKGYGAVYKKRPRSSSSDGCAIFFRKTVFELIDSMSMEFVDKTDPSTGKQYKDRVALLALLKHCSGRRLIFISTHLARNPEDPSQTKSRAKQTAQLLNGVTQFAKMHDAMDDPVMLAGDLNTTNIRQIANIARAVFELCSEECHPIIFSAAAPRTLHTSVTTTRKMTIDYLFAQVSIDIIDRSPMPYLHEPIPNAIHPSDHVPIAFKVGFKRLTTQLHGCARAWAVVLLTARGVTLHDASLTRPLQPRELTVAFDFWDLDMNDGISPRDLRDGLAELGMPQHYDALKEGLDVAVGRAVCEESMCTRQEFEKVYHESLLQSKSHFENEMLDAFSYFDTTGDGHLEEEELFHSFVAACPFTVDRERFNGIFTALDANGDGSVTVDEFARYLLGNLNKNRNGNPIHSELCQHNESRLLHSQKTRELESPVVASETVVAETPAS